MCKDGHCIDDAVDERILNTKEKAMVLQMEKERQTVTTKTIDILFQRHQNPLSNNTTTTTTTTTTTHSDGSKVVSISESNTKHSFGGSSPKHVTNKKKHSLHFDTFVELMKDVAYEIYKGSLLHSSSHEEEEDAQKKEEDEEDEEDNNSEEDWLSKFLELKMVPLALSKGGKKKSPRHEKQQLNTTSSVNVLNGSANRRESAHTINIDKIGQQINNDDENDEDDKEDNDGQEKKKQHRRQSTAASAAEVLELAIAQRSSIVLEGSSQGNADLADKERAVKEREENEMLLQQFEKPLRSVFTFYCTLTKVAPNGSSNAPSKIVRTHLTYNDVKIFLKDFYLMPAYVSNSGFQEIWHSNQLGRDHNEYINWMSYVEFRHLLVSISRQIPLERFSSSTSVRRRKKEEEEKEKMPKKPKQQHQLGRLLSGLERGISNMQKRGASALPRFYSVTYE